MKYQRCVWVLAAVVLLLASLGVSEASAFGPRRVLAAPAYYSYPTYGNPYYSAYGNPYYSAYGYPYVMPLPGYGVLPLPLATPNWGYGYGYDYSSYGIRRTADDYGYARDPLAPAPRMRSSLYPAVPFERSSDAAGADGRRVRFEIAVPYADATVTFDGAKTKQTGLKRVFVTPPMDDGKEYTVTIVVQWTKKDGELSAPRQKAFNVKPGQTIQHTFVE